jgi:ferrous iron transport protein B
MNAEISDRKWFWGGIGLQLGTGYTVGYLVYTIGTLITAPETLNVGTTVGGALIVAAFAAVLVYLCVRADKKSMAEYALQGKK